MKKKIVPLLLFGLMLFNLSVVVGLGLYWYKYDRKPEQPIAYSHQIHVEKLELECTDCHQYADQSPQAGIPSMQLCMDCHESAATDHPDYQYFIVFENFHFQMFSICTKSQSQSFQIPQVLKAFSKSFVFVTDQCGRCGRLNRKIKARFQISPA